MQFYVQSNHGLGFCDASTAAKCEHHQPLHSPYYSATELMQAHNIPCLALKWKAARLEFLYLLWNRKLAINPSLYLSSSASRLTHVFRNLILTCDRLQMQHKRVSNALSLVGAKAAQMHRRVANALH